MLERASDRWLTIGSIAIRGNATLFLSRGGKGRSRHHGKREIPLHDGRCVKEQKCKGSDQSVQAERM